MSFTFKWPRFSEQFHADAIQMLNAALNKGNKPPVIADRIEVVELEMGLQPPELEIRDIGELTMDQFRGIFRFTYSGDAHLVLRTKVQANPLNHKQPDIHLMAGSRGMLAAKHPLVVPMLLRLSHFKLNSYVVLVVSKQKGITLVFKTDPLQNVDINSSFDSIAVIQKFIQREIEGQLRQMFREDLPGIIHRLSQQWVKATVEAPCLSKRTIFPSRPPSLDQPTDTRSAPNFSPLPLPHVLPHAGFNKPSANIRRVKSSSGLSAASRRSAPITPSSVLSIPDPQSPSALPDIENFDPTYGLRPEGLPAKSLFGKFSKLFAPNKGLADLSEEPSEEDEDFDESASFDILPWEDTTIPPSVLDSVSEEVDDMEFETIPAVGGGVITRPRIYHSQSQIQNPAGSSTPNSTTVLYPMPLSRRSMSLEYEPSILSHRSSWPARPGFSVVHPEGVHLDKSQLGYKHPSFTHRPTQSDTVAIPTPPPSDSHTEPSISATPMRRPFDRRSSFSSSISEAFRTGSPPDPHGTFSSDPDPKIILRPSLNNHVSKLSTLSHSNHTLSPYTRSLEHFTVRSVPPRGPIGTSRPSNQPERQPSVKARRKRIYHLGRSTKDTPVLEKKVEQSPPSSPVSPEDFDASDMDRYFKWRDEIVPHFPLDVLPSHMHRRSHSQQQQQQQP